MNKIRAQVGAISSTGATVCPLTGVWKGQAFRMPPHPELTLEIGQFVDFVVHPSGQRAEWALVG